MSMKRIKQLEGKTITTAEHGGGDFAECDNRTLELKFTDGTTFCFNVQTATLECEGELYPRADQDKPKKLFAS